MQKRPCISEEISSNLFDLCSSFSEYVNRVKNEGKYFYMRKLFSPSEAKVIVNGRKMINLASNNYLGLTNHPRIKEAAIKAIEKYGTGSGGSRILSGTFDLHEELEKTLAKFKKVEDVIAFSTGYMANLGTISSLIGRNDVIICDNKNHASIIDGCWMSKGKKIFFKHNDMAELEKHLNFCKNNNYKNKLVVVDGIFSMDGDIANLPKIYELAKKYNAITMIDEAHATGVLGKNGRGTPEYFELEGKIDIVMGTQSKSLAGLGGFIGAKKELITFLKHNARSFLFATSLPPSSAATAIEAISVIQKEPWLRKCLWTNQKIIKQGLEKLGFNTGKSESPIIPILIGDEMKTYQMAGILEEEGIFAVPVAFPAVKRKECRIRISIMASHTSNDLEKTLNVFNKAGKKLNLI